MSLNRINERSWTHDRSDWGAARGRYRTVDTAWGTPDAPWHTEPDKVQWTDSETGYACLAVRNHVGAWCGYVGLPPRHPLHGMDYYGIDVAVHGGLTYAARCQEEAEEGHGICHIPEPGQPDAVWWLGFDCAHGGDLCPRMPVYPELPIAPPGYRDTYRTLRYVQGEVTVLAQQLAERSRRLT